MPRRTVGSRQAEHKSQGESMEEDDMVKSRVGNTLVQERQTDKRGRGCKPKGAYKEVPRPSQRLGLATTKSSLTTSSLNRDTLLPI